MRSDPGVASDRGARIRLSGLGRLAGPSRAADSRLARRVPEGSRARNIAAESTGAVVALILALIAIGHVAATARSWMLFYDGDSVLPALIHGSLSSGQPQTWSLSAVLFLPETALYLLLAVVATGTKAALALNAIVNFVLLYAVLRSAARLIVPWTSRTRQIGGAVLALAMLVALSTLDSSDRWDGAELPSLLATTTYYSATVLAMLLTPPIAARVATRSAGRGMRWASALVGLSTLSTLTNPLYLGWVVVPLAVVLLLLWSRKLVDGRPAGLAFAAVAAGGALGLLLRIPLSALIPRDSASYADPGQALHVLFGYYLRVAIEGLATVPGAVSLLAVVTLLVVAGAIYVDAIRLGNARVAVVAGFGWLAPVIILIGAVALGTHAYRYLQPLYFAPLLALVALPALAGPRLPAPSRSSARRIVLVGTSVLVAFGITASTQIASAVSTSDASIDCVTSWVTASHRVGAGRFTTIRGPKAYLTDPRQLVQVTPSFAGYLALVNRDDYRATHVSFIVSDAANPAPRPPSGLPTAAPTLTRCGRYTISDYHRNVLPVGPPTTKYDP
jgi:hypothetical protein